MHSIQKLDWFPSKLQVTGYRLPVTGYKRQVPLGRISVGILKFFKTRPKCPPPLKRRNDSHIFIHQNHKSKKIHFCDFKSLIAKNAIS